MKNRETRYYLDANAWLALKNTPEGLARVHELIRDGDFSMELAFQNAKELVDPSRVSAQNLRDNLHFLEVLGLENQFDSIFILGQSELGQARISGDSATTLFGNHMTNKKRSKNHVVDGIHLVNSWAWNCILVTCDSNLRRSAAKASVVSACGQYWLFSLGLSELGTCSSCLKFEG